jgi:hypothetical protein
MLNHKGEVAECTGDNIFLVRAASLLTPPIEAGILEGITRDVVIELARGGDRGPRDSADQARRLHRRRVLPDRHRGRSRSGGQGRQPPIGDGRPGPITLQLLDSFPRGHTPVAMAGPSPLPIACFRLAMNRRPTFACHPDRRPDRTPFAPRRRLCDPLLSRRGCRLVGQHGTRARPAAICWASATCRHRSDWRSPGRRTLLIGIANPGGLIPPRGARSSSRRSSGAGRGVRHA